MQRRLVRERRAVERGKEERAGAHLAHHLAVLRLVADEQIALAGSDQDGKKERDDGELQHAQARHSAPIVSRTQPFAIQ